VHAVITNTPRPCVIECRFSSRATVIGTLSCAHTRGRPLTNRAATGMPHVEREVEWMSKFGAGQVNLPTS
jgi:hypothetical protein